ncbi:MAG: PD-(D/E)XK nuclease family protein, partial [Bacteroidales bacterium]|nr:PD-(D/E)XK nuclease family protein [Bacteroidales bacterium]
PISDGGEYPSFALNPDSGASDVPASERGRLRLSADALDFFSDDGNAGISASNRIRGVVLHDILSRVSVPSDLDMAVQASVSSGEITEEEAEEIKELLAERISEGAERGWFPDDRTSVMNEASLIASDGSLHRPDRVVYDGGRAIIIDYKFGGHEDKYRKQLMRYAEILSGTGVAEVSAVLWYVRSGEVVKVC